MTSINTMEGMIDSGLKTIEEMKLSLPAAAFQHSFGLILIEAVQVGFIVSAGLGTGILLRHDKYNNTWSAPLAVGISSVGAGFAAGLERKHMVIFVPEFQMMHAMAGDFSLRLGVQSSLAVANMGEEYDLTANINKVGGGITSGFTKTSGLYVGVELEGAALAPRTKVNEKFYGKKLTPKKVLFGQVEDMPTCESLDKLYATLNVMASAPKPDPSYVETIARPFAKNTSKTNTLDNQKQQ